MVINGNDPEESYIKLQEAFDYIRSERKPVLLEAMVSRLYGHSSASGANRVEEEDCLEIFEQKLIQAGYLTTEDIQKMRQAYELEAKNAQEQVRAEAPPSKDSIWEHFYANGENGDWRKF